MYSSFLERTNAAQAILPVVTIGNSTVTGVVIDRQNYKSCAIEYSAGVTPSIPTGFTVALVLKDCATTNGTFAAFATVPTFGTASPPLLNVSTRMLSPLPNPSSADVAVFVAFEA
jgi:hypothetical protein